MEYVSKIAYRLLEHLKHVYDINGINYSLNGLHSILIRLLGPFELLNHFHMVDSSQLFKSSLNLGYRNKDDLEEQSH